MRAEYPEFTSASLVVALVWAGFCGLAILSPTWVGIVPAWMCVCYLVAAMCLGEQEDSKRTRASQLEKKEMVTLKVVEFETGKVVRTMECSTEREADKVERGLLRQMNLDEYYVDREDDGSSISE